MFSTVLIVDDNARVRRSLRFLLETRTEWNICGEAENGADAVQKVRNLKPDVVILDLAMPVMNGLEAAREICKIAPSAHMVMYTMHANDQLAKEAAAAGIQGVVCKDGRGSQDLLAIMRRWLPCDPITKREEAKRRTTLPS